MARKPPAGGPSDQAGTPPAAEVEAAIQKALDALRPRAPTDRGKRRAASLPRAAKPRPRPANDD